MRTAAAFALQRSVPAQRVEPDRIDTPLAAAQKITAG
jgi:hypothetical protein